MDSIVYISPASRHQFKVDQVLWALCGVFDAARQPGTGEAKSEEIC